MAEYFYIPLEGGWEKDTYYVCEVSMDYESPVFAAIIYSGCLNMIQEPGTLSGVISPLGYKEYIPLKDYKYIKAIHKIDMTIPNKGKQIKELNIFELKDHMKERPDVRFT